MNNVVDNQENINVSLLGQSMDSGSDPALELYRTSRETMSEAIEILKQQLHLKKKLALEFESRVGSLNAEFLGFSKNTVVENPVNVDLFLVNWMILMFWKN